MVAAGGRALVASRGGALESSLAQAGGELIRLPVHTRDPLAIVRNIGRLTRLIRKERVSLAHVRSRAPAFSVLPAAKAAGVPMLATYHGIYQANGPLKRWYNGVMTRGDMTLANSQFTRDHIIAEHRLAPERLVVVTEGIDTRAFNPGAATADRVAGIRAAWRLDGADRRPVALLAARLTGWKGQAVMIQALARVPERNRPWLILAGRAQKPGDATALAALAANMGVAEQVRFPGPIEDMAAAYAAADLVVAPSTLPESFGRGVAEACAMARPVLASPLGGPGEIIVEGETGWFARPGDAGAWAAAAMTVLAMPHEARRRVGLAARARIVERFSLETMTRDTFAAYRRLLRGSA